MNKRKHIRNPIFVKDGVFYKKCSGECGLEKELNKENFQWRPKRKTWEAKCKVCAKNIKKIYYINNKDKVLKDVKKYNENHKMEKAEYLKIYAEENKEEIREYKRDWQKNKSKDPQDRIRRTIAAAVRKHIKQYFKTKDGKSILKHLSYTMKELEEHLQNQFEILGNEWMTWDNYGKYNKKTWDDNDSSTWTWHIDHIIPHSKFKYDNMDCQEFRDCWALSNLRPYSAKQNIIDGNRR